MKKTYAATGIALAALGGAAFHVLFPASAPGDAAGRDAPAREDAVALTAKSDTGARAAAARAAPGNEGAIRKQDAAAAMRARWFEAPALGADETFPVPPVPMRVSASCKGRAAFARHTDLGEMLDGEFDLSGARVFPDDVLVTSVRQFLKTEDAYEQLSAEWQVSSPPVYKVERNAFENAELAGAPRAIPVAGVDPGKVVDAESARAAVTETLKAGAGIATTRGGRILTARVVDASGKGTHEATFLNGIPVAYHTEGAYCEYDFDAKTASCHCEFATNAPTKEGTHP